MVVVFFRGDETHFRGRGGVCVCIGREYRDISDRGVVVENKGVISTTAVKKK